ncbi:Unknown protein sequence [Pseudomonas coronafaciens pv. oryzae]|nr:Unknown protein sequence [Pseudomonas coronafaciens pv. oryzae]
MLFVWRGHERSFGWLLSAMAAIEAQTGPITKLLAKHSAAARQ